MPPSQRTTKTKDSIEHRRARGELSCAECRQHKVKCDKSIPCSTCVRKGCQAICPNGTTPSAHASRISAPDTGALHARITAMSTRIRELEDALQISRSSLGTVPRAGPSQNVLKSNDGVDTSVTPKREDNAVDADLLNSFGSLAVTNSGTESYLGCPNVAQVLLVVCSCVSCAKDHPLFGSMKHLGLGASEFHAEPGLPSMLPAPISFASETFPFASLYRPVHEIQTYIEEKLPSYARASALVEAYLENLSWFFRPVDREQIMEELIPAVYKRRRQVHTANGSSPPVNGFSDGPAPSDPHALALLLAIFAAGAAADLTLPPWNDEANLYYHLACAALGLKPVFEGTGLHTVQAIALIGAYDLFACRKNNLEGTWKILGFSSSLAASIGLNRDPAHFKLSPKLIQRRRRFFWELHSLDVCKSICTGWPVTFTSEAIDCKFPDEAQAKYGEDGTELPGSVWWFRYRFIKEVLTEVVTKLGASHAIKYSEILALDKKIRDFDPQRILSLGCRDYGPQQYDGDDKCEVSRAQISLLKDMSLLLLHRNFFVRALVEDPLDPLRTQFGPSFLSTFRSAVSLLSTVREQFLKQSGNFFMRLWPTWAHALSATVMLGSIAACGPQSDLASQAYIQFNLAFEMFSDVQMHPLVKSGLPVLARLREQALEGLSKHGNELPVQLPSGGPIRPRSGIEGEDFKAVTRLGRTVQKDSDGELSTIRPRTMDLLHDYGAVGSQSTPSSATEECSIPFSNTKEPYFVQGASPMALGTTPPSATTEGNSSPGHEGFSYQRSDTGTESTPTDTSALYTDMSQSSSETPAYCKPTFSGSPSIPDALNAFTTFSDMHNDFAGPSADSVASFSETQESSLSALDPQRFLTGPSDYNSQHGFSAGTDFTSDFDIEFDMRASMGQESVLPLLPHDMDAWRTILQDSRFFGIVDSTS